MKKTNLLLSVVIIAAMILNSCSVERRYHRNGLNINWKNTSMNVKKDRQKSFVNESIDDELLTEDNLKNQNTVENQNIAYSYSNETALATSSDEYIPTPSNVLNSVDETKVSVVNMESDSKVSTFTGNTSERIYSSKKLNRIEKRNQVIAEKLIKKVSKDDNTVLCVILAFFIPPLAVYLFEGSWTKRCTINLILTLLCGLPGLIHALVVILGK
jgi:uncharacterized membrane protein YqaE (UPF0057 family)